MRMFEHLSGPSEVRHLFTTSMKCAGCGRRKAREWMLCFLLHTNEQDTWALQSIPQIPPPNWPSLPSMHHNHSACFPPVNPKRRRKEATNPSYISIGRKDVSCGYTWMLVWETLSNAAVLGNTWGTWIIFNNLSLPPTSTPTPLYNVKKWGVKKKKINPVVTQEPT